MSDHQSPQASSPHPMPEHGGGGGHEDGEGNWLVSYADMMTLLVGFFVILNSFSTIDNEKFEGAKRSVTREFGGTYQIPYKDITDRMKNELDKMGLGNDFVMKQSDAGIEISFYGTVFFEMGSADLKGEGTQLIEKLIPIIKSEKTDFEITVEGHTDDVPISRGGFFRSNWELSSIRACRVLNVFESNGFSKDHLTAVGFADAHPILPNRDKNGEAIEENQSQNRRVVIKLLKHAVPTIDANPGDKKDENGESDTAGIEEPPKANAAAASTAQTLPEQVD